MSYKKYGGQKQTRNNTGRQMRTVMLGNMKQITQSHRPMRTKKREPAEEATAKLGSLI